MNVAAAGSVGTVDTLASMMTAANVEMQQKLLAVAATQSIQSAPIETLSTVMSMLGMNLDMSA